jgi:hypothetical protein
MSQSLRSGCGGECSGCTQRCLERLESGPVRKRESEIEIFGLPQSFDAMCVQQMNVACECACNYRDDTERGRSGFDVRHDASV